jgi:hypothetical protein
LTTLRQQLARTPCLQGQNANIVATKSMWNAMGVSRNALYLAPRSVPKPGYKILIGSESEYLYSTSAEIVNDTGLWKTPGPIGALGKGAVGQSVVLEPVSEKKRGKHRKEAVHCDHGVSRR